MFRNILGLFALSLAVSGCSRSDHGEVTKAKAEAAAARAEADAAKAEVAKLQKALAQLQAAKPASITPKDNLKSAQDQARTILKQLGAKFEEDLSIPGNPVVAVNLDAKNVSDEGLSILCAGTPRLKKLSVLRSPITAAGLVNVAKLPQLEELDLGEWDRQSKTSEADLAPLAESKSLKSLRARLALQAVTGETVKRLQNLEELEISHSLVDDNAVRQLATLGRLRKLDLSNSRNLTDAGIAHLKALTNLEKLNLYAVAKLTDKSLDELKALKNLKDLHIDYSKMTYEGVQDFRAALPSCRVYGAPKAKKP